MRVNAVTPPTATDPAIGSAPSRPSTAYALGLAACPPCCWGCALPHSLLVAMDSPTIGVPPGHSGNSVCDGLASPLNTPSTYGRTHHSCSMLLPCTLPYRIVHTFGMGALPGQVRSGAWHPGAVWLPDFGWSGSVAVPPQVMFLVPRLSRSIHGHHGSLARCSCSSALPSFL
ncbi:hypothetical protein DY000_02033380 [Brassica cretica]|uniref:Uncharacterized protein n=1 Tax=Brassica cretica TaxID=69181 RepID=A0ABQ7DTI7_BRACR|nr:hypothetical protein DY000_02033380 [Brassica cretica]